MKFIRKHWKMIFFAAAVLTIVVLLYQYFYLPRNSNQETVKVKRGRLEETLTVSGEIKAAEHAILQFQTGGQLTWVGVSVGDRVKKYQTLASLDQRQVQKTLDKYLQAYKKDRNAFDQAKDTYKDQVISDTIKRTIENSQADLNDSVLDVELADITRQFANLWSPIDGIVTRIDTPHSGVNIVSPALAQFEVVNPKTIYFEALADQTEVITLKEGDVGKLSLDAYPDSQLNGTIKTIAFTPTANQTGTVYNLKFNFSNDNSDYQYKLGMTGDLSFITSHKDNVLYLPSKFIKTENGKKIVTVRKPDKDEKVIVKTGLETDSSTEIKSGLKEGQMIVSPTK